MRNAKRAEWPRESPRPGETVIASAVAPIARAAAPLRDRLYDSDDFHILSGEVVKTVLQTLKSAVRPSEGSLMVSLH